MSNNRKNFTLKRKMDALIEIRASLLVDEIAKDICKEAKENFDILTAVPIEFEDMDVTAKTVSGSIKLNPLLIDKDFNIMMRYVIHELVHVMQHISENSNIDDSADNYLDKESEVEAFQRQIEFDSDSKTEKEITKYIKDLLDHHDYPKGDREKKEEELRELED
jgi:hypothetical protein